MFKHFKGARLGIFIFIGTVFIILSIFLIGNKESLFVDTIKINSKFVRVEGLKTGAPVRLSGLTIGSVTSITLADDTSGAVIVGMNIEKNVRHFIRLDSEASIETEGLVGKKVVSITPGSKDIEMISDGTFIRAMEPVNISEIIEETQAIMAYIKDITKDFSQIVEKINAGQGTIGKLVNDDELYKSTVKITQTADVSLSKVTDQMTEVSGFLVEIAGGAESIFQNIDTVTADVKTLIDNVQKGEGVLGALMADRSSYDSIKTVINNLVKTTESTLDGAESFAENMEALKHNWLFKSYFEQRGYWDKSDYEKEIDDKLEILRKKNEELEAKLNELREMGLKINKPYPVEGMPVPEKQEEE
ncbi:MAG: MCE family protein [Melioribacteraceae bacterium]|nr:MCE family protein [Melioribacteraceae bacterium]